MQFTIRATYGIRNTIWAIALSVFLVLPAQAYFIEWQGPPTDVFDLLEKDQGDALSRVEHTFSGGLGINDLLFQEALTEVVVFGGEEKQFRNIFYQDQIRRDFIVRRTDPGEVPIAPVTMSGAFDVSLFLAPSESNGAVGAASARFVAEVLGTGLGFGGSFNIVSGQPNLEDRVNFSVREFLATDVLYTLQLGVDTNATSTWDGTTARVARSEVLMGARISVPEPSTLSLLIAGLVGFGLMTRRRRAA